MRRTLRLFAALALLLGASCAQESTPAAEKSQSPERIVSLSPSATEMLFAIGAGDQVVAVDDQSTYPPEAPTTKLSGLEPNHEAIIEYDPDLVVSWDQNAGLTKALKAVDVPLLVLPAAETIEDTYAEIEELGEATGHEEEAADLVGSMKEDIDAAVAGIPDFDEPPTYYHELDDTYYSVTSKTFVGQVYALFGMQNIADEAKGAGSGYPQLSAEYIIDANPDLIFLADTKCCAQTAATVRKRPGWDAISAVRNDGVVELDDDIASRWGPRVVDLVETVAEHVTRLQAKG